MIEQIIIKHAIQKHIIDVLCNVEIARFRDLRPPSTDTNLFSYHLKLLQKNNLVIKVNDSYKLSQKGMYYVETLSSYKSPRTQPKIVTMLVIQNSNGAVLLHRRGRQPYIGLLSLPHGKVHLDDLSIKYSARRELKEKLNFQDVDISYAGEAYLRFLDGDGSILAVILSHIFRGYTDKIEPRDDLVWVQPHKLSEYRLVPGTEQVMTRTFFNDPFFFEEYNVSLTD